MSDSAACWALAVAQQKSLSIHVSAKYQYISIFIQIFRLIKDLSLTTDSNTSTTTSPSSANTSALLKDTVPKIWDAGNGCLYVNVKGHQFKKQPLEFRITANMFFSVSSLEKLQALQEEKIYLIKPVSLIHWYRLIA